MKPKILLVEDDETLGYILKEYLEMNDYAVFWAKDGKQGVLTFQQQSIDLCILDVMMPEKDGFTVAKEIKTIDAIQPIIFLTAKSLKIDKLKGFYLGADDYITKPIDEEELLARIKAVLRRSSTLEKESSLQTYEFGNSSYLTQQRALKVHGESFTITEKEAKLLVALLKNKNQLLDRNLTLKEIWGKNDYFNRRSMDVHISHLRKLLKNDESIEIVNVHSKGFILKEKPAENKI